MDISTNIKYFYATNFTFVIRFMKTIKKIILFSVLISIIQCNNDKNKIDIDDTQLKKLKAIRLEQQIINSSSGKIAHDTLSYYPELYQDFYSRMLRIGSTEDLLDSSKINSKVIPSLNSFISDSTMKFIFKAIEQEFPSFDYYETEISKGFARFQILFKKENKKNIGTFYSNFNATVIESDKTIWIGLDMYLGKDHPITKQLPPSLPQYYKDKMDKKFIISDVFFGYLMSSIYNPMGDELLAKMLSYGKIAYVMNLILPNEDEGNKFRYSKEEITWCNNNEEYIWKYIIDNKLLFEKDLSKISLFFSDGPFTKNFGPNSPSGIGIWMGYQMILDYAKKTNKSTIEIINEKDIQKLLSTYEPN